METALNSVLLAVPQAAAIWSAMIVVAVLAAAALSLSGRRSDSDADATLHGSLLGSPTLRRARGDGRVQRVDERAWAHRYADEIVVAADRAAATARRRRAEWQQAQHDVDRTWAAFDAADRAARRSAAAAAFVVPDLARTPAQFADRERFLHRAVIAACRRGELSVVELNEALAHRGGWDPRRHPAQQEAMLHQAVRHQAVAAHRAAIEREQRAWHTAEVAAAALRSLREEACAAKLRAGLQRTPGQQWWAEQWAPTAQPQPRVPQPGVPQSGLPQSGVPQSGVPQPGVPQPRVPQPASSRTGNPVRQGSPATVTGRLAAG